MTTPHDWAAPDDRPAPVPPPAPAPPAGQAPADSPGGWHAPPGWGGPTAPPPPTGGWGAPHPGHAPPPGYGAPAWGAPAGWGAPRPPDVKPGVVPLRPLGLGELLDGAVALVRRYPRPTLGLSAAIAIVTTILNLPFLIAYLESPLADPTAAVPTDAGDLASEIGSLSGSLGGSTLVQLLAAVVLAGVITAVVGRAVLGQQMSLGDAWSAVRPLLLRLIGLAVLILVIWWGALAVPFFVAAALVALSGPATLLLGVPLVLVGIVAAVHLYVRFALAPSAMVLERIGIRASLRRSSVLVKGDWWRVFGILLLAFVITAFVTAVLQTPFEFRSLSAGFTGTPFEPGPLDYVLSSIGQALALTVISPFAAAVSALLYVDRRMRAEGLDVALTAAAATAGRTPADRPAP